MKFGFENIKRAMKNITETVDHNKKALTLTGLMWLTTLGFSQEKFTALDPQTKIETGIKNDMDSLEEISKKIDSLHKQLVFIEAQLKFATEEETKEKAAFQSAWDQAYSELQGANKKMIEQFQNTSGVIGKVINYVDYAFKKNNTINFTTDMKALDDIGKNATSRFNNETNGTKTTLGQDLLTIDMSINSGATNSTLTDNNKHHSADYDTRSILYHTPKKIAQLHAVTLTLAKQTEENKAETEKYQKIYNSLQPSADATK